ncbi:MAG: ATP-dependent zinc protease [Luteolibacter sp.]
MSLESKESARPVTLSEFQSHALIGQPVRRLLQIVWLFLFSLVFLTPLAATNTVGADEKALDAEEEVETEEVADNGAENIPAEEREAMEAAVARPVPADPVQVFGWREKIKIQEIDQDFHAKLDTGALTSSIHAEDITLFERDGNKWVRFIATNPREENAKRIPVEAPLVRYARIKEVGGESARREVVRLRIRIGGRSLRGEFTLANRSNMLVPVLIGRTMLKDLGWVDPGRTYLAEQEIFR